MKAQLLFICALAALSSSVKAADSQCLTAAKACYPKETSADVEAALYSVPMDINNLCPAVKTALDCINKAQKSNSDCVDKDIQAVSDQVINDSGALCDPATGKISPCKLRLSDCLEDAKRALSIVNATSREQREMDCGFRHVYFQCADDIIGALKCDPFELEILNSSLAKVKLQSAGVCDTDCGGSIGQCMAPLTKDFTQVPLPDNLCSDYKSAYDCLTKLSKKTECQADLVQYNLAVFNGRDYCNTDGSEAVCQKNLRACAEKKGNIRKMDVNQRCNALNEYMECTKKAGCTVAYNNQVMANQQAAIFRKEALDNCSLMGDCKTQWSTCTQDLRFAISDNVRYDRLCTKATQAKKCTCQVLGSTMCKDDQKSLKLDEQHQFVLAKIVDACKTAGQTLTATCPASDTDAGVNLQGSMLLMSVVFLLTLFKF